MGGEENGNRRAGLCAQPAQGWAEPLGKGFGQERVLRPGSSKVDAQAGRFGFDGAAVEAHAGAGVLRREAEDRCFFYAIGAHLADYIGDIGAPVAHADIDADGLALRGQFGFDEAGLLQCDFSERAAADEGVAVLDLFDDLLAAGAGR